MTSLVTALKAAIFGYFNPIMATNFQYLVTGKPKDYTFQFLSCMEPSLSRTCTEIHSPIACYYPTLGTIISAHVNRTTPCQEPRGMLM